jgi:homoaconitase/3-isopropylmalate dehydratase large subunit
MKSLPILAAAALVVLGSSLATAQDTTRKDTTRKVSAGEVVRPVTVASLVTVVNASLENAAKVSAIKPDTPPALEFVDAKPVIANEADEKILKEALDKNKDGIKQLADVLKQNTTIKSAMEAHAMKPSTDDVIGVEFLEPNKLAVYFWKR